MYGFNVIVCLLVLRYIKERDGTAGRPVPACRPAAPLAEGVCFRFVARNPKYDGVVLLCVMLQSYRRACGRRFAVVAVGSGRAIRVVVVFLVLLLDRTRKYHGVDRACLSVCLCACVCVCQLL